MIVFPAIDLRQGRCVRLRQGRFDAQTTYSEDPLAVARRWVEQGARWLHAVNLDGALGEESPNTRIVADIVRECGVPVQFGGGLRDLAGIEQALKAGVARVILGTVAIREPDVVKEAVQRFGAERIVVGIDSKGGQVATHGWLEVSSLSALQVALSAAQQGVRRIVATDISRDGTLTGANVQACIDLARGADLRVIVSGGVAGLDDIRRVRDANEPRLDGVIVGQALYTGAVSLQDAIGVASGEVS